METNVSAKAHRIGLFLCPVCRIDHYLLGRWPEVVGVCQLEGSRNDNLTINPQVRHDVDHEYEGVKHDIYVESIAVDWGFLP